MNLTRFSTSSFRLQVAGFPSNLLVPLCRIVVFRPGKRRTICRVELEPATIPVRRQHRPIRYGALMFAADGCRAVAGPVVRNHCTAPARSKGRETVDGRARKRLRHTNGPGSAWARGRQHDDDLYACPQPRPLGGAETDREWL